MRSGHVWVPPHTCARKAPFWCLTAQFLLLPHLHTNTIDADVDLEGSERPSKPAAIGTRRTPPGAGLKLQALGPSESEHGEAPATGLVKFFADIKAFFGRGFSKVSTT